MRTLSRGLRLTVALFSLSSVVPSAVEAVAIFDRVVHVTLIIGSSNPLLLVQNVSATQSSGDGVTPGTDATATASAVANSTSMTIDLMINGQTGAIVPATASAFAEGTVSFTLANTDPAGSAPGTLSLAATDTFLAVSVDDASMESARLDDTLELKFVQEPGANVIEATSVVTPPNVVIGPFSSGRVLSELIFFPATSLDVSLFLRVAGEATATGAAAVPEPDSVWSVTAGLALTAIAALATRRRRRRAWLR